MNPTPQGNRVYWIDRECYVVYMGKGERQFRPFLRIGTSPDLPEQVRRHIGSVVLPDRMTGDYFEEPDCLERPVTRNMHYVGSPELIKAVRHFIRKEEIKLQPIQSIGGDPEEQGTKVHFFRDGNLRLFMDGHRLFDLSDREKSDNHFIYRYHRAEELLSKDSASLDKKALRAKGFIPIPGLGNVAFENGELEVRNLSFAGIRALARFLIPVSLVSRFAGPANRDALFSLVKWNHVEGRANVFVMEDLDAATGPTSALERDFLELLENIRASVSAGTSINFPSSAPIPADYVADEDNDHRLVLQAQQPASGSLELQLPEGDTWYGGITPPLLPAVPYQVREGSFEAGSQLSSLLSKSQERLEHLMGSELRAEVTAEDRDPKALSEGIAQRNDDSTAALAALLWLWNDMAASGTLERFPVAAVASIEGFQQELLFPISVSILTPAPGAWTISFHISKDLTRNDIRSRKTLREKVMALIEWKPPKEQFVAERQRLTETLALLLNKKNSSGASVLSTSLDIDGASEGQFEESASAGNDSATSAARTSTSTRAKRSSGQPVQGADGHINSRNDAPSGKRSGILAGLLIGLALLAVLALIIWFMFFRTGNTPVVSDANAVQHREQTSGETSPPPEDSVQAAPPEDVADNADQSPSINGPASSDESVDSDEPVEGDEQAESYEQSVQESEQKQDDGEYFVSSNWSAAEILMVANWIAVSNGYAELGESDNFEDNPDWIYTGNEFVLPDSRIYTVGDGDMIWTISDSYLTEKFAESGKTIEEFRDSIRSLQYNRLTN